MNDLPECYSIRFDGDERAYIISPTGKRLYFVSSQIARDVFDFVHELNSHDPKHSAAYDKMMNFKALA